MTFDDTPPSDDELADDELAAAYLDDEASATERARVESDPGLLRRVEEFRAVRGVVRASHSSVDDQARDLMIDRALAAADLSPSDGERSTDDLPATAAPVAPAIQLDDRRRHRRRQTRIPTPGLVAAAVAVLLLIGAGLLITADDLDRSDQAVTAGSSEADRGAAEREDSAGSEDVSEFAPSTDLRAGANQGDVEDLGNFPDAAALRQALVPVHTSSGSDPPEQGLKHDQGDQGTDDPAAPSGSLEVGSERCEVAVKNTDTALGSLVEVRVASIEGRGVWIFTHTGSDDESRLTDTVVDRETCQFVTAVAR